MFDDETREFVVVENDEKQCSIWPADLVVPPGWRIVAERGTKAACLAFVEAYWTDMRPLSLRLQMEDARSSE